MSDRTNLIKETLAELRLDLTGGDLDAARVRFDELIETLADSEYAEEDDD